MATMPVQYPFGPASVSGTTVSVDVMLDQPTRITRYLSDLSLQNFFANRIFATPGGVTGGGLVYDQLTVNDIYTTRDVENIEPGAEFPIVDSQRSQPLFAPVEKFGGKFFITDEARLRNDQTTFRIQANKLANTIVRKINTKAIAALDASVAAIGAAVTITGNNWGAYQPQGSSASLPSASPAADFAKAQLAADTAELGVNYNLWITNPAQVAALRTIYGTALAGLLSDNNIEMVATNRVAVGTAYVVEEGMSGEMRFERQLATETWREQLTERTWVQSGVSPVFAVTNPYSVLKVTGLAG
jgi:hypothetical protein